MTPCIGGQMVGSPCSVRPAFRVRAALEESDPTMTHLVCAKHLAGVITMLGVECSVGFLDIDVRLDEDPRLSS